MSRSGSLLIPLSLILISLSLALWIDVSLYKLTIFFARCLTDYRLSLRSKYLDACLSFLAILDYLGGPLGPYNGLITNFPISRLPLISNNSLYGLHALDTEECPPVTHSIAACVMWMSSIPHAQERKILRTLSINPALTL